MEADRTLIGSLIFIALIVGSNFALYASARGWFYNSLTSFQRNLNN